MLVAVLGGGVARAWTPPAPAKDQDSIVEAAQKMALGAVHFEQGDAAGFKSARANFTEDGWKEFLNRGLGASAFSGLRGDGVDDFL